MIDPAPPERRLLRHAPLVIALGFAVTRLPHLGLGWQPDELASLTSPDSGLLPDLVGVLAEHLGEPYRPGPLRLLALVLAAISIPAWAAASARLGGRVLGRRLAWSAALLLAASPLLDVWVLDLDLGALVGWSALGLGAERLLTYVLRGGTPRLLAGLAASLVAGLAPVTAWTGGPWLVALLLLAFPSPRQERRQRLRRRAQLASGLVALTWLPVPALQSATIQPVTVLLALVWMATWPLSERLGGRGRWAWFLALLAVTVPVLRTGDVAFDGPLLLGACMLLFTVLAVGHAHSTRADLAQGRGRLPVLAASLALFVTGLLPYRHVLDQDARLAEVLAVIETGTQGEARVALDSTVYVLDPERYLPIELPALLQPPYRAGRIPVTLLRDPSDLAADLALQEPGSAGRRSLVVVDLAPHHLDGDPPFLRIHRGWTGEGDLEEGVAATTDSLDAWIVEPPLPQHAFGAVELEVPTDGLDGVLELLVGNGVSEPRVAETLSLHLTPAAPGKCVLLTLGADHGRLLDEPLVRLRFEGPQGPRQAPRLVPAPAPPSLLLPGADHVLDLRLAPPELQAWYPPEQLRPTAFRLDVELETSRGEFDLSTGGQVPAGAPGDLRLRPVWLDRTSRWNGPTPGSMAEPWRDFLDQGLLHAVRKGGDAGTGRWRLCLFWPGGLRAGQTPWEHISWRAAGDQAAETP